jgi:hypothetical protein
MPAYSVPFARRPVNRHHWPACLAAPASALAALGGRHPASGRLGCYETECGDVLRSVAVTRERRVNAWLGVAPVEDNAQLFGASIQRALVGGLGLLGRVAVRDKIARPDLAPPQQLEGEARAVLDRARLPTAGAIIRNLAGWGRESPYFSLSCSSSEADAGVGKIRGFPDVRRRRSR